ncbi:MAG: agmatine deiminase family protein [Bacteroidaceae bacterium]|nr:agmatine deiminase family protein [Bacteroidaceae bacterium]
MGLIAYSIKQEDEDKTLRISATEFFATQKKIKSRYLPAEWENQSAIQLTWPHQGTDWAYMLEEVTACYINLAREISCRQPLLIVTPEPEKVQELLGDMQNVYLFKCATNDTWARDHGFITLRTEKEAQLLDFQFNGWGMKFAANLDNQICRRMAEAGILTGTYKSCLDFVLEGGSIESDGCGTLLTTSECLLSPNRNDTLSQDMIESRLMNEFNLKQVLWLDHGYLAGDDTDSHIDTLARLCPMDTIVYVQCLNPNDEHYDELQKMEAQLKTFRTLEGNPYRLLPLPMADPVIVDGERLPATYANFLIMNKAVLYPTYNQPENDTQAAAVLQEAFPTREIVGINCEALIKQHGSLHCVTMQFPEEVFNTTLNKVYEKD